MNVGFEFVRLLSIMWDVIGTRIAIVWVGTCITKRLMSAQACPQVAFLGWSIRREVVIRMKQNVFDFQASLRWRKLRILNVQPTLSQFIEGIKVDSSRN